VTVFVPESDLAAGIDAPIIAEVTITDFSIEGPYWAFVARVERVIKGSIELSHQAASGPYVVRASWALM
jgi:hypothetical protein